MLEKIFLNGLTNGVHICCYCLNCQIQPCTIFLRVIELPDITPVLRFLSMNTTSHYAGKIIQNVIWNIMQPKQAIVMSLKFKIQAPKIQKEKTKWIEDDAHQDTINIYWENFTNSGGLRRGRGKKTQTNLQCMCDRLIKERKDKMNSTFHSVHLWQKKCFDHHGA